jgi:hypothetical protein
MKMNIETNMTNDWWELEDNDHPDIKAVDKFLFLADRLFDMGNETEEAKTFEFSRIVDYLDVYTDEGAKIKIRETANPFYERALRSTRDKLETGQVNSNMLEKARNTLGITEEDARQMSIEAFDEEVRIQLGVEDVEDNIDYDDEIEYDENKRISTDGEGRDLLSKWTKMREDAKAKELSKATVESTSVVKFKEGAFEHVSLMLLSYLQCVLRFVSASDMNSHILPTHCIHTITHNHTTAIQTPRNPRHHRRRSRSLHPILRLRLLEPHSSSSLPRRYKQCHHTRQMLGHYQTTRRRTPPQGIHHKNHGY